MTKLQRENTRVLIVGGGPAGCAAALQLVRHGYTPTIIERSSFKTPRAGEALLPAAEGLLRALGVWERFEAEHFEASPGIVSAWGSAELTHSSFLFQPFSSGWNLDRVRFDHMLLKVCRDRGCRVVETNGPMRMSRTGKTWDVTVATRTFRTDWLVDATGRAASVATRLGPVRIVKNRLMALIGYAEPPDETGYGSQLLVESVHNGWWYSAGLPDGRFVVAFLTDADIISRHVEDRRVLWNCAMRESQHTIERVRFPDACGRLRLVNANTSRLDHVAGDGWIAIGDAAIALDPLSGNGIIRALQTGIAAADVIVAGGDPSSLELYCQVVANIASDDVVRSRENYRKETRWNHPFWQRRQDVVPRDNAVLSTARQPQSF